MPGFRDIAGDAEQLHGSASGVAHDRTFHHNPALLTFALAIQARSEAILCPATPARTFPSREGIVQFAQILGMHLRPHLRQALLRRVRPIAVNMSIAPVIFEAAAVQVKAPGPELGTV